MSTSIYHQFCAIDVAFAVTDRIWCFAQGSRSGIFQELKECLLDASLLELAYLRGFFGGHICGTGTDLTDVHVELIK